MTVAAMVARKASQRGTNHGTAAGTDGGGWAFAGGGDDLISAMGGRDSVAGGEGRDTINGGTGADRLYGEADRDVLSGDGGNDRLFGGAAHFVFEAPAPGTKADRIADFGATDRLVFAAVDLGLGAGALLDASYLAVTGGVNAGHARFVYSAAAKSLYWDADGLSGTADQLICTFDSNVSLLIDHFVLV